MELSSTQRFLESLLHVPVKGADLDLLGQLHQALYQDGAYISDLESDMRGLSSEELTTPQDPDFIIDIMMVLLELKRMPLNCLLFKNKVFLCVTFAALACGLTQGLLSLNEMEVSNIIRYYFSYIKLI